MPKLEPKVVEKVEKKKLPIK
jgi:DNA-binding GntR family transcriptional regulator